MKCPICNKDMVFIEKPDGFDVFVCTNSKCRCAGYASDIVWKFLTVTIKNRKALSQEFIRTRKALDYAKDKLDTVRQYHRRTAVIYPDDIAAYCDRAIDQITALEQKE